MAAIETLELSKSYGRNAVLHEVSLRVEAGSCCGLLGPNGAGKSTLIRIMLGLLRSASGEARILGRDCRREGTALRADVGYLPGDVRFDDRLRAHDILDFFNRARGGGAWPEARRLAAVFDLNLTQRVRSYSHGMKQKLGLIQAMMHRPRLLVLDEPTTALDPLVRRSLFAELRSAVGEGRTVLFSSHTLSEVEELCDHVILLRDGRVIEQDRVDLLRRRALRRVEIALGPEADRSDTAIPVGLRVTSRDERRISGVYSGEIGPLLDWLGQARVSDVTIGSPDLEDLFIAYYSDAEATR